MLVTLNSFSLSSDPAPLLGVLGSLPYFLLPVYGLILSQESLLLKQGRPQFSLAVFLIRVETLSPTPCL
jgi:hypothetical protein